MPVNLEFWKLWTFLYILLLDISWTILHWTPANDPKIGQKEKLGKTCASQPQVSGFLHFASHRFSAFWLRSKCSICSYQLNIWYDPHVGSSILIWFLDHGEVLGACSTFATDRPGIVVPPGSVHKIIHQYTVLPWYNLCRVVQKPGRYNSMQEFCLVIVVVFILCK